MAGKSSAATIASSSSSSGKELQSEVNRLADSFSTLNPNAKEFLPVATQKSIGDGSSNSSRPNYRIDAMGQDQTQLQRTIHIPELSEDVTESDLAKFFEFCGTIKDCRIHGDTKSSQQIAFIEFSNESEARMALSLSGRPIFGNPNEAVIKILPSRTIIQPLSRRFIPKSNEEEERAHKTIYCTNIDRKVSETQLINFFKQFCGEVTEFKFMYDPKHSSCIAFIEFAQLEASTLALRYSGTLMGDRPIRISASKTAIKFVSRRRR